MGGDCLTDCLFSVFKVNCARVLHVPLQALLQVTLITAMGTPVAPVLILIWSMVGVVAHDCGGCTSWWWRHVAVVVVLYVWTTMIVTGALTVVHLSLPELHNIITMQPYESTVWDGYKCSWQDRVHVHTCWQQSVPGQNLMYHCGLGLHRVLRAWAMSAAQNFQHD